MNHRPVITPLHFAVENCFGQEIREYPAPHLMACPSSLLQSLLNWGTIHLVGDSDIKIHKPTLAAFTGKNVRWVRSLVRGIADRHRFAIKATPDWESEWETLSRQNARGHSFRFTIHLVFETIRVHHAVFNTTIKLNRPFNCLITRQPRRHALWRTKLPCEHFSRLVVRAAAVEAATSRQHAVHMITRALRRAQRLGERIVKDDKLWVVIALPHARVVRAGIAAIM